MNVMWRKIDLYLFQLFLISLPFDHFYSEVALITLMGYTILVGKREDWKRVGNWKVWGVASLYGVTLLGSLYSKDKMAAAAVCFQQLPLLLFPLLAAYWQPLLQGYRIRLLNVFSWTIIGVMVYLFADALRVIHYFHLPLSVLFSDDFTNQHFSSPLDQHATYLSLYAGLCLGHLVQQGLRPTGAGRWLSWLGALILTLGLIQLSAKSVWIGLIGMGLWASLTSIYGAYKRRFVVGVSFLVVVVVGFLLWKGTFFQHRMIGDFQKDFTLANRESRLARWEAVSDEAATHPWWGYGTGMVQPMAEAAYFSHGLYEAYLLHLNTHNQFLSWWLSAGIIGLLVYLGWLCWGFYQAATSRDALWVGFMIMIACVSVGENILDVQHGLFFLSFFYTFFYFSSWKLKQP
jgi:O-antigen ligase